MTESTPHCIFCPRENVRTVVYGHSLWKYSCPDCGDYFVEIEVMEMNDFGRAFDGDELVKINCRAANLDHNENRGLVPFWAPSYSGTWIGLKIPEQFQKTSSYLYAANYKDMPVQHAQKSDGLLIEFAKALKNKKPLTPIKPTAKMMYRLKIADSEEMILWLKVLINQGLLTHPNFLSKIEANRLKNIVEEAFTISPKGWQQIESLQATINSNRVFIAIDFNHPNRKEYEDIVKKVCHDLGYVAATVADREHCNQITDEIIAGINQSKFIVAELWGNNGNVYYEAGFAHGKKLPVLLTCEQEFFKNKQKQKEKEIKFDVRQFNILDWANMEDLERRLKNRILAVIRKAN